jgi:hypothetical protein
VSSCEVLLRPAHTDFIEHLDPTCDVATHGMVDSTGGVIRSVRSCARKAEQNHIG